eukprot:scaffold22447_cov70-Phaeocystis_antarctica.AAC.2
MLLLSTIGGTLPATLGSNGYYCTSCAHCIALARIALADRPSFPNLPPCLPLPIGLIALLACAGAAGKAKGGYNSKTSCEPCDPGEYSGARASSCTDCAAGKYSNPQSGSTPLERGEGQCEPCAAGMYSGQGSSVCTDCARGKYSVGVVGTSQGGDGLLEKGQGDCAPCASGKYSPSTGRSSCLNCTRGKWSGGSASSCTPCEGCAAGKTRGGCTVPLLKTEGRPCSRAPRSAASAAWETLVSGDTGPPRWEAPNVAQPLSLAPRSAFVNCRYRAGCGGLQLYGDDTVGKTTAGTCEACDQVIPSPRREKRTRPTSHHWCAFLPAGPLQDPCSDALVSAGVLCSPLKIRPLTPFARVSSLTAQTLGATVRVVRPPNLLSWLLPWWHGLHRNRIWHAGRTGRRYLELGG